MIRFRAFSSGPAKGGEPQQRQQLSLDGLHLFAQDEIPVRSQFEFAEGELIGLRHNDTAVGLVTLWEIEGFGKVLLQTTRLPGRDKPYNLNVELARGRLLKISQKREEWGMSSTDLTLSKEQHDLIDRALDRLVTALAMVDEPDKAAHAANESLGLAMRAGEEMALTHARLFLERRCSTQGFSRHSFGCCMDPSRLGDAKYLKYLKDNFRFVTVPVSWRQIEPQEHEKSFELLDTCVDWLSRNRIAIKVGPLLRFAPAMLPDWLFIWENDFEQVREMAYEYITSVVERYGNKVQAWDVVSGLNAENCFKFSFEQIIEMTRSSVLATKRAAPRSLVLVELTEPWGEYYAYNQRTLPPMIYLDMICQSGVNLDGLGVKLRFGRGGGGMRARDLLDLSSLLDRAGLFGKPVHLASVQAPSEPDKRDNSPRVGDSGYWHSPWSEAIQAEWLEKVYQIALSKPYVETITWEDLADRDEGVLTHGGLLRKDLTHKPAFEALCGLKKELVGTERTRGAGTPSSSGA